MIANTIDFADFADIPAEAPPLQEKAAVFTPDREGGIKLFWWAIAMVISLFIWWVTAEFAQWLFYPPLEM